MEIIIEISKMCAILLVTVIILLITGIGFYSLYLFALSVWYKLKERKIVIEYGGKNENI